MDQVCPFYFKCSFKMNRLRSKNRPSWSISGSAEITLSFAAGATSSCGFLDVDQAVGRYVLQLLNDTRWPPYLHQVGGLRLTQAEVDGAGARRSVPGGENPVVVLRVAARYQLDPRPNSIAIAPGALQLKFQPVIAAGAVVEPDFGGSAESRDNHIETPVAVEISDRRAAMPGGRLRCQ